MDGSRHRDASGPRERQRTRLTRHRSSARETGVPDCHGFARSADERGALPRRHGGSRQWRTRLRTRPARVCLRIVIVRTSSFHRRPCRSLRRSSGGRRAFQGWSWSRGCVVASALPESFDEKRRGTALVSSPASFVRHQRQTRLSSPSAGLHLLRRVGGRSGCAVRLCSRVSRRGHCRRRSGHLGGSSRGGRGVSLRLFRLGAAGGEDEHGGDGGDALHLENLLDIRGGYDTEPPTGGPASGKRLGVYAESDRSQDIPSIG